MRAVLTNFGTTGDILPLLALAHELRAGGHQVLLGAAPNHEECVRRHGLPFEPVGPDLRDAQTAINRRWVEDESSYTSVVEMAQLLAPLEQALAATYADLRRVARHAEVIISGPAQPAARMVHETAAIPFVSVQFSHFGGSGTPALQAATASLINPFRQSLGLPPLANPVTQDANSPQLALYAMSRHLLPTGSAWPPHHRVVGFFMLPSGGWKPDSPLAAFLGSGEPPVVVSFGSMPHDDPDATAAIVEEAAGIAGVRAVLQQGDHEPRRSRPDARVHVTGFAPHTWLFPRASCVVHHGGGGTAGAAFAAGRPTVYVPHGRIFDQHYWARLSRDIGCSREPIPYHELTARALGEAIRETVADKRLRETAARLGQLVRAERGVSAARRAIETLVARVGLDADDGHVMEGGQTTRVTSNGAK
jgi:sterol 3beta-glucosyltransferase